MAKRIFTVFVLIALLFLFIFPARFLEQLSTELVTAAKAAIEAALDDDWGQVYEGLTGAYDRFLRVQDYLHLFLDHEEVLELEVGLQSSVALARAQDLGQLMPELSVVISQAQYLNNIENFNIFTLL